VSRGSVRQPCRGLPARAFSPPPKGPPPPPPPPPQTPPRGGVFFSYALRTETMHFSLASTSHLTHTKCMEDTKRIETATMVAEASLEAPKTAEQTLSALRAAQSAGGKKAHENLTPAERTERGKRAAAARWGKLRVCDECQIAPVELRLIPSAKAREAGCINRRLCYACMGNVVRAQNDALGRHLGIS
jgi:hypothetical protein